MTINRIFTYKGRTPNASSDNLICPWVLLYHDEKDRNLISVKVAFFEDNVNAEKARVMEDFQQRYPSALGVNVDSQMNVTVIFTEE